MCSSDLVLLGKESSKGSVVPEAVQSLLDEFANVFPNDLPEELPPLRDIQHKLILYQVIIYLIARTTA